MKYVLIILPILLIFLEQKFPAGERPTWKDYLNTVAIMAIGLAVLFVMDIDAVAATASRWVGKSLHFPLVSPNLNFITVGVSWIDSALQIALTVILILLAHDAWFYFSHRLEHRFPALWAFHKVHHSEERMNIMTSGRDHFLQSIWRSFFSFLTIGLLIDLDFKQALVSASVALAVLGHWSMFYHSSIRIELPWLDKLLVTPQVHRIHHSKLKEHQDKNFADMFPIFDIIGGTYCAPKRGEFPDTGLTSGERHPNIWSALWAPFAGWKDLITKKQL
jgi:sterol desaturase/sphingolipid hydroxylase (fatty acid hydroxylase superfamily)